VTTGNLRDDIMHGFPGEPSLLGEGDDVGLSGRQLRDLAAVVFMLLGVALLLGALASVDIRLAVGVGGGILLLLGVLLAVERSPKG
jgi:hypothetical protein